jgi:hypothetical protein
MRKACLTAVVLVLTVALRVQEYVDTPAVRSWVQQRVEAWLGAEPTPAARNQIEHARPRVQQH